MVAWVFGREHTDRTFPSLFALPVSRASIAKAKYLLGSVTVLSRLVVVAFGFGFAADVGPLQLDVIGPNLMRLLGVATSASVLSLTIGLVASIGRGYPPAFAALILIVAAGKSASCSGPGDGSHFAVPGLIAIHGSEGAPVLNPIQIALVPSATAVGVWLTVRWWHWAEVV